MAHLEQAFKKKFTEVTLSPYQFKVWE